MKQLLYILISIMSVNTYASTYYHIYGMIQNDQSSIEAIVKLPEFLESLGNVKVFSEDGFCSLSFDLYEEDLLTYSCLLDIHDITLVEKINTSFRESSLSLRLENVDSIGIRYQFIGFDKNYANSSLEMAISSNNIEDIFQFRDTYISSIGPEMKDENWTKFLDDSKIRFGDYHIGKIKQIAKRVNLCAVRTISNVEFRSKYSWHRSNAFFSSNWMNWNKCEQHLSDLFLKY